ncbi:MAG TPA: hypothetical protein VNA20_17010 [Frankiaceae bacterium]|nr:hypothetical protein [Frankiaceae bacterium]
MRKWLVVALCAATSAAVTPGAATASHTVVTGTPCSVYALQNDEVTGQSTEGVIEGGPVVAVSGTAEIPFVTLGCRLVVNGSTDWYQVASGDGTATLNPTRVAFSASPSDSVTMCTLVEVTTSHGTATYYYDAATATYSQSSGALCSGVQNGYSGPIPPAPFYPMGIIDITGYGSAWTYSLNNVFPPTGWTCTTGVLEVSCDPPPAPPGTVNNCRILTVRALNHGLGTVSGNARCLNGGSANATSAGPATSPTVGVSAPGGEFPWKCKVTVIQPIAAPWEVTCTISH